MSALPDDFDTLYDECLARTRTAVQPAKADLRRARARALAAAFLETLEVRGERGECGVLRGFTALLLCRLARRHGTVSAGAGFYLIDSFEGLSPPGVEDLVEMPTREGGVRKVLTHAAGHFATPMEHVQDAMKDFSRAEIIRGWIPQVLRSLPEKRWAFVHLDLDLYAPTFGALEYFHPRMAPGGVIVGDDFVSGSFPGAGRAWREFCAGRDLVYVELPTGQAVLRYR